MHFGFSVVILYMLTHCDTAMAHWDIWIQGAIVSVISNTGAFPATTGQSVCCEKAQFKRHVFIFSCIYSQLLIY